ncbi:hypothetical protein LY76DRAFT_411724 [Colletotrichum caudatum]|nr:hypothetical protein LY76DRAFT_411724 [Colletotrichum caudatum]
MCAFWKRPCRPSKFYTRHSPSSPPPADRSGKEEMIVLLQMQTAPGAISSGNLTFSLFALVFFFVFFFISRNRPACGLCLLSGTEEANDKRSSSLDYRHILLASSSAI